MILLDEEDQQQPKLRPSSVAGPTSRNPEDPVPGRDPLPDYETSQALQEPVQDPDADIDQQKQLQKKKRRKCLIKSDPRFWRATVVAFVIYVLITAAIGIPLALRHKNRLKMKQFLSSPWGDDNSNDLVRVHVNQGQVVDCNTWQPDSDNHSASLQFNFPIDSSVILESNVSQPVPGPQLVHGSLLIDMNPDSQATDTLVSVNLNYSSDSVFEGTMVCHTKGMGTDGVSIKVPNMTDSDSLSFNMTVLFPPSSSPLVVQQFVTYLPVFTQRVGNLNSFISFEKITIEGPMSNIFVESVQGSKLVMKSSLAPISGTFNASQSLILDTIAAPINANITLVNSQKCGKPTFLDISTGNSGINASVTLVMTSPTSTSNLSPQFLSEVTTFDGPLNLNIAHSPSTPPTNMHLRAQNNLEQSNVVLDSKYEGTFDVQTKFDTAIVQVDNPTDLVDPLGENRQRTFEYDVNTTSRMLGWVGWGARPKNSAKFGPLGQGHVEVVTSLSPVMLILGDS